MKRLFLLIPLLWIIAACGTTKKAFFSKEEEGWATTKLPDLPLAHTVFLIGDAGEPDTETMSPNFKLLQKELLKAGKKSAVVFLGDNIYPAGLPPKDDPLRAESEKKLDGQLLILEGYQGRPYFIPGNHDWNRWAAKGLKAVKRQEDYIEKQLGNKKTFLPGNGCGDPYKIKMADNLVTIFIDSQWWLHDWEGEKKMNKGCEIKTRLEFLDEFEELIRKNKNKNILVLMHHPFFSNGSHGGHFSAKEHIFPLSIINEKLYVPLPVIGSLMPIYRSVRGSIQDIPHEKYQRLKDEFLEIIEKQQNIVFAAGHEHSLQYFEQNKHHFIVSGSGTKSTFARKGAKASFVHAAKGFSKLYYYKDGSVWMEFMKPDPTGNPAGIVCFRKQLKAGTTPEEVVDYGFNPQIFKQDSVAHQATTIYEAGKVKRFWMGDQYRDAWGQPVKAPLLDLTKEFGGLTPLRKGGGQSTVSLRMEGANGKQYALRGINKEVEKVVPEFAQGTIAQDVFQDQISAVHPYGAFVIPPMAKAAGIYHTNPRLFYVPKQAALDDYNEVFGNELYLLEERPAGNREDVASFGASKKIINFGELLDDLQKNPKHKVDEEWVLKSRLFDVFIHDWDRHDDQWRWAKFKENGETIYRPIPRDRDQVFYQFKGVLPWVAGLIAVRKFKSFHKDFRDVAGQSFNARDFDRSFLTSLEWPAWEQAAKELQANMTDEVLEDAFKVWQQELYDLNAPDIIAKLKNRREQIPEMAWKLYRFISKQVNIVGTNERERFEVNRLENGHTEVVVYWISNKKGRVKQERYRRNFDPKVTKELRLYGLDEEDEFIFNGTKKGRIKVRLIGGLGKDFISNNSKGATLGNKTVVYDAKKGKESIKGMQGSKSVDRRSNDLEVNAYERIQFKYNNILPLVSFGLTYDDGFFLGAGFQATKQGFRKEPYHSKQALNGTASVETGAFKFKYKGEFIAALKFADLLIDVDLRNPQYRNYFGIGNRTKDLATDKRYNWVRMEQYQVKMLGQHSWNKQHFALRFGPSFEAYKVLHQENRITEAPFAPFSAEAFERKKYLGAVFEHEVNATDHPMIPEEGIIFKANADYHHELEGGDRQYARLGTSFTYYLTFGKAVKATVGMRVGANTVFGDYLFYNKQYLGGKTNLRGFRNERFQGQTIFYHNNDLRLQLFHWKNKIAPMGIGLIGGFDYGRVWDKSDASSRYFHRSYTAGLFLTPYEMAAITFNYSFSKEEKALFSFGLGFFF